MTSLNPAVRRIGAYLGITLLTYPVIFLLTMLFIILIGSRLPGMSFGAMVGVGVAWLLFPILFWRPITPKIVLLTLAVLVLSYACLFAAGSLDLHLLRGPYELYDFILFFSLPCMLFFELANHFRWSKA